MVLAILRFTEFDGRVRPPEPVEIIAACTYHVRDCIEVHNVHGEPMWVRPDELAAE